MQYHTCQSPEYKNLEMSRNLCIVGMSFKTMSRNNLQKSPKRHSERPGDLTKNLETPGKTGRVGRYAVLLSRNVKGVPFAIKGIYKKGTLFCLHGIQKDTRLDPGAELPHRKTS